MADGGGSGSGVLLPGGQECAQSAVARLERRRYLDAKRKAERRGRPFPLSLEEWTRTRTPRTHAKTPAERKRRKRAALKRYAHTPRGFYRQHKQNAAKRGVEFTLTYEQWFELWEPYLDKRGHCDGGYVMARAGDQGGYTWDNVSVVPHGVNVAERNRLYFASRRHNEPNDPDYRHVHSAPGVDSSKYHGEPGDDVPF